MLTMTQQLISICYYIMGTINILHHNYMREKVNVHKINVEME